jgi:uncharacterized protein YndB with AHSA1/START domain
MKELFADQTITISAPIEKVWQAITDKAYTSQWAKEFTNGAPFRIESDWQLSKPVAWRNKAGKVLVEGIVNALDKPRLLRFTVFAANAPHAATTEEDGITWRLQSEGVQRFYECRCNN